MATVVYHANVANDTIECANHWRRNETRCDETLTVVKDDGVLTLQHFPVCHRGRGGAVLVTDASERTVGRLSRWNGTPAVFLLHIGQT